MTRRTTIPLSERPEVLSDIASRISDGQSFAQIYRETRVARSTVRKYFPDYHGKPGGDTPALRQERLDALKRMVEDGVSQSEIARSLGMCNKTIKKYFPDAGWGVGSERGVEAKRMSKQLKELRDSL